MAFTPSEFVNNLVYDGARPNYFQVLMNFPPQVVNSQPAGQKTQFLCKSAQLPSVTMGIAPAYYYGRELKLAGNPTYQDWTITIYNDEDFLIRNAFENWQNLINSHAGNLRDPTMANYSGYTVSATVNHMGKIGNIIKEYDFVGMWPTDPSMIDLDWQTNDTIEEFTVTLAYQYWTSTVSQGQSPATTS